MWSTNSTTWFCSACLELTYSIGIHCISFLLIYALQCLPIIDIGLIMWPDPLRRSVLSCNCSQFRKHLFHQRACVKKLFINFKKGRTQYGLIVKSGKCFEVAKRVMNKMVASSGYLHMNRGIGVITSSPINTKKVVKLIEAPALPFPASWHFASWRQKRISYCYLVFTGFIAFFL